MTKFVIKRIEEVQGKQRFDQLVILPDSRNSTGIDSNNLVGEWDGYENRLEERYRPSFRGLLAIMNRIANLESVPKEKFKDITPSGETVKEFEIKFQDLRAYGIKMPNGRLMILGGYKNSQKADISKFRGLKRKYLEFVESQKKSHEKSNKK